MKNILLKYLGYIKLYLYKIKCRNLIVGKNMFFHPKARILIKNKRSIVKFGEECHIEKNCVFIVDKDSYLDVEKGVIIKENCNFEVGKNAKLIISDKTFFNSYCRIVCLEEINIGKNNAFGPDVYIFDNNHIIKKNSMVNWNEYSSSKISIGNNSWIGARSLILKGTTIGNNCIIAGMSVTNCIIQSNKIFYNKILKEYKELND